MKIYNEANWTKFTTLLPEIRKNVNNWKIISIFIAEQNKGAMDIKLIAEILENTMGDCEGAIFLLSTYEVACFAKVGADMSLPQFKEWISHCYSQYNCRVVFKNTTIDGVQQIEVVLSIRETVAREITNFQKMRMTRKHKEILIVDDDMFIRTLLSKAAGTSGHVTELSDGNAAIEKYKEIAPDAVFMDIHMPGKQGTDILKEITQLDPDSFVIMVSADSAREQVIEARRHGAKWFFTKPVTVNKVMEALSKSPAFQKKSS